MNIIKKTATVSAALCVCACVAFTGCSETEVAEVNKPLSDEEINSRYEEIFSSAESVELLPDDYNPIVDNFTTVDFQITDLEDGVAFNLPENSYADITPTATNFNFFDSSVEGETFEGSFKTAKGLSLSNTLAEHAGAYKIDQYGAVALLEDSTYADYYYATDAVCTKITCGFSSSDGIEFSAIAPEELRNILSLRDSASLAGDVSDDIISQIVEGHQTVALVDLYPQADGALSQISISRFDQKAG